MKGTLIMAFTESELASVKPWRVRCLEIRGRGEAIDAETSRDAIIRIHPTRVISFGIDQPDTPPHELVPSMRDI